MARLDQIDAPRAVHGIRKNLKKTRALLRLVRSGLAEQPAANQTLREVGLALSARRDAAVRLATLDRLFPDRPEPMQGLYSVLALPGPDLVAEPVGALRERLISVLDKVQGWSLSGKDTRILRAGLADTRAKALRTARAARRSPHLDEAFHDWRKRAKDFWYQSRLFAPVWPDLFAPLVASADRLGEMLGDHHDLAVLRAHVAALPDAQVPDLTRQMLARRLDAAQAEIEARAFPLSARLFAGDPEAIARIWTDWRRIWRENA
nr:CHAD domain-containing protein [Rhodobacter calidifons]